MVYTYVFYVYIIIDLPSLSLLWRQQDFEEVRFGSKQVPQATISLFGVFCHTTNKTHQKKLMVPAVIVACGKC